MKVLQKKVRTFCSHLLKSLVNFDLMLKLFIAKILNVNTIASLIPLDIFYKITI